MIIKTITNLGQHLQKLKKEMLTVIEARPEPHKLDADPKNQSTKRL